MITTALAVLKQTRVPTGPSTQSYAGFELTSGAIYRSVPEFQYTYDLVHLARWRDRDYRDAIPEVEKVVQQMNQTAYAEYFRATGNGRPGAGNPVISLLVDQTGIGESVIESLRAAGLGFTGILIHGGDAVSEMEGGYRVPKKELVGIVEVLLQNRRLRIARALPMASVLVQELEAFKATTKLTTGHTSYAADESWRENPHDDTVLAVAMAAWFGETQDPVENQRSTAALIKAYNDELSGMWS